jgi:hypothetical protein
VPPGLPVLGVVPPQMPCMRSCSNANSWRTGHPVQVDLAFAICSRARPVDEIGKNRSGSACAHPLASRQSAPSRGRHSAFLTGERVIPRNERAASRQPPVHAGSVDRSGLYRTGRVSRPDPASLCGHGTALTRKRRQESAGRSRIVVATGGRWRAMDQSAAPLLGSPGRLSCT